MDPETEKHFAALIMEEAARLKLRADKEGVHAYLAKPTVRGKPNPQFLKAMVRGIEQTNRASEINGMWKQRALELELEERERKRSRQRHSSDVVARYSHKSPHSYPNQMKRATDKSTGHRNSYHMNSSPRLHYRNASDSTSEDDTFHHKDHNHAQSFEGDLRDHGLREEEVDQFLHSRVKRGRGAVGSRMDETGPYPAASSLPEDSLNVRVKEEWEQRIIGPSMEFGEKHRMDSKNHRMKKEKVDETHHTSIHKVKKREKKKKHRSVHKKSRRKSDALKS